MTQNFRFPIDTTSVYSLSQLADPPPPHNRLTLDGVRFARVCGAVCEEQAAVAVDELGDVVQSRLSEQLLLVRLWAEYV